jgi:hypothetical protein
LLISQARKATKENEGQNEEKLGEVHDRLAALRLITPRTNDVPESTASSPTIHASPVAASPKTLGAGSFDVEAPDVDVDPPELVVVVPPPVPVLQE